MKEILTKIIKAVQSGDMASDVAVKAIMKLHPPTGEMYNEANDFHYAHFVKYLKEYAEVEAKKLDL